MTATRRPLEPSFQALIDGTFPGCEPGSEQRVVRVVIAEVRGSAPREPGAAMLVSGDAQFGTIGGGRLEFEAVRLARLMLAEQPRGDWQRRMESWPLGPNLGQCCGGHVGVLFEIFGARERDGLRSLRNGDAITRPVTSGAPLAAAQSHARAALDGARFIEPLGPALTPVFIYGAGHTGRAIVKALEPLDFAVTWIDTAADRFPGALSEPASGRLTKVVTANPARSTRLAADTTCHVVLTYAHAMDLDICDAVLRRQKFRFLGLIGSATKRARFVSQLRKRGIDDVALSRMTCPIGLPDLNSKHPAVLALGVAAQLQMVREADGDAHLGGTNTCLQALPEG